MHILNPFKDQQDLLEKFLGVLRRFNGNLPIPKPLQTEIEEFFIFTWQKDLTSALREESDRKIYDQLPIGVRHRIYHEFLFYDFLHLFRSLFRIKKAGNLAQQQSMIAKEPIFTLNSTLNKKSEMQLIMDWNDSQYAEMVVAITDMLEPRMVRPGQVVLSQNQ